MDPLAAKLLGLAITSAVLVGWMTRRVPDPGRAAEWRRAHRLPAADAHDALVTWYVRTAATMRVVGGVGAITVGTLFDEAFGTSTSMGLGFWAWVCVGWVVGGTWAYLAVVDVALADHGAAAMVARRAADYAPLPARVGPLASTIAAVAIATVTGADHLASVVLVAVGLLAASTWCMRRVIDRAQPADDLALLAVDDAMRSATCHLLGAGATATILLVAAHGALVPATVPDGGAPLAPIFWWATLLTTAVAIWFARYLADRPWRVRRALDAGGAS